MDGRTDGRHARNLADFDRDLPQIDRVNTSQFTPPDMTQADDRVKSRRLGPPCMFSLH